MMALRGMARSQEKINESQELTTQDDIVLSIPPRRDDEEKRGRGNDERTESRLVGTEKWRLGDSSREREL